ncbi:MAG TPA: hypothetical protein PLE83_04630 [Myxococcota bacterium]|nr:hypothetical protein [Myxococcota bacterium]
MRGKSGLLAFALVTCWVFQAQAAHQSRARTETWDAPPPDEQLAADPTLIPPAQGAIFVPAMTDPRLEPPYLVYKDGKLLHTVSTGRRAIVTPGVYDVQLGSGPPEQRLRRKVLVKEGQTTVVPPTWGAVVVRIVDERFTPFRGSYELLALPKRQSLGVGLGADVELGDEERTWILAPGKYMLIRSGANFQARRDFFTFRLAPGEQIDITLVIERETGVFLGAGEVELPDRLIKNKDLRINLVLGGDAEVNRRSDMVGFRSGFGFTLGGFVDFLLQYKPQKHYVYTRLKLEEKQVKLPGTSFQKDLDELKFGTVYVYRVVPWFGPYIRVSTQTALFPGTTYLESPTEIIEVDRSDRVVANHGVHQGKFRLSDPLAPSEIKGGVGLGFIAVASNWFDANIRLGFGGRMLFNRGLYTLRASGTDGVLNILKMSDAKQYGIEGTIVASLRITRWVVATTELELLEPVTDWKNPIVDWQSNVGLRLASFVSFNYIFKMLLDRDRSAYLQTEHRLVLRLSWQIL